MQERARSEQSLAHSRVSILSLLTSLILILICDCVTLLLMLIFSLMLMLMLIYDCVTLPGTLML